MLLNHIAVTAAGTLAAARLRCHAELSLLPVSLESHEASTHAFSGIRRHSGRYRRV
jgi:hypothetical protein